MQSSMTSHAPNPTHHSLPSSAPSFVTSKASTDFQRSPPLRFVISVSSSISREISTAPAPSEASARAPCWDESTIYGDIVEPSTTITSIEHSIKSRAPLYQLSAPLSSRPEKVTISRYTLPQTLQPENLYASSQQAPVEPIYSLSPLSTPLGLQPQVHKCLLHDLRSRKTHLVSTRLTLRGFGVQVHAPSFDPSSSLRRQASAPLVYCRGCKWYNSRNEVLAETRKSRREKTVELELAPGVQAHDSDLCIAGWIAGVWMKSVAPRLHNRKDGVRVKGRNETRAPWMGAGNLKEKEKLRDAVVTAEWKEGKG